MKHIILSAALFVTALASVSMGTQDVISCEPPLPCEPPTTEDDDISSALMAAEAAVSEAEIAATMLSSVIGYCDQEHGIAIEHASDYIHGVEDLGLPEDLMLSMSIQMTLEQSTMAMGLYLDARSEMSNARIANIGGCELFDLEMWWESEMSWWNSAMMSGASQNSIGVFEYEMLMLQANNDQIESDLAAWGWPY